MIGARTRKDVQRDRGIAHEAHALSALCVATGESTQSFDAGVEIGVGHGLPREWKAGAE